MSKGGMRVKFKAEHRSKGRLIVRQATMPDPPTLCCPKFNAYMGFLVESIWYSLLLKYDEERTAFAEKYKFDDIPEYYRTGERYPQTVKQAVWALTLLKLRRTIRWHKHNLSRKLALLKWQNS